MYDTIIVGGAGAGLTAAIYASRLGLKTLVITKDIGGRVLANSPYGRRSVENYPGFDAISGVELMKKLEKQARDFGAEFVFAEVTGVEEKDRVFTVKTHTQSYESRTVILAFGETPRSLGIPGEEKYEGKGRSYCAHCDALDYKGKDVAVVGFGDRAMDSAALLSKIANKVYLIYWWGEAEGPTNIKSWAAAKENVEIISSSTVGAMHGEDRVEAITTQGAFGEDVREIKVDALFVELGSVGKTEFLLGFVDLNSEGKVNVDKECCTSRPGVFAAGDVTDSLYKQVVISAGDGARAALSAFNYLRRLENKSVINSDLLTIRKVPYSI